MKGRFPANLLVSDDILNDGHNRKSTGGIGECSGQYSGSIRRNPFNYQDSGSFSRYFSIDHWWIEIVKTLPPHNQQLLQWEGEI